MEKRLPYCHQSQIIRSRASLVKQALPTHGLRQLSPFLLLQHYGPEYIAPSTKAGEIHPHPHKGTEIISMVLQGCLEQKDSHGNHLKLESGDVSWLTAGAGIIHSEIPHPRHYKKGGPLEVIHLWINLPQKFKQISPYTQLTRAPQSPYFSAPGIELKIIAGTYKNINGLFHTFTPLSLFLLEIQEKQDWVYQAPAAFQGALYFLSGEGIVNEQAVKAGQIYCFDDKGLQLHSKSRSRCLLVSGSPIAEPMVRWGPFVMTSQQEVIQAQQDYYAGKMGVLID